MKETFDNNKCRLSVIIPKLPQLCVVNGAAKYGLKRFVFNKTYGIKCNKMITDIDTNKFHQGFIQCKSYYNTVIIQFFSHQFHFGQSQCHIFQFQIMVKSYAKYLLCFIM